MDISKGTANPNPQEVANPISKLCFWYTFGMFKKGYKKNLEFDDIYNPLKNDRSSVLGTALERNWRKQLTKSKANNTPPSLLKAIVKTFWVRIAIIGILVAICDIGIKIIQSQLLGGILNYFKPGSELTKEDAMYFAGASVGLSFAGVFISNQYKQSAFHGGIQMKAACCALMYRKALKLSKAALGDTSPGKMVNLLSNDVARFDSVLLFSHQLWTGPVSALIVVALLYRDCGFSGLIGAGVVFAIMPIQSISGKLAGKYRSQTAAKTDERVRLMDEIIGGIQVIKMYAWEKPFAKIIEAARKAELDIILKGCYLNAPFMILNLMTTKLALFITLLCMALTGQEITVAKGFVLATYLNTISVAVVALFARCVSSIAEARVAIKRIREFLLTEEHEPVKSLPMILNGIEKPTSDLEKRVALKEVTAKWSEKGDRTALKNLNMDVSNGALVGVVGAVGSGKSSLLQTILGELVIAEGSMTINGKISYASQDSWIFAATVRQNIVFCQEYEEKRYNEVVRVCALEQDFKDFENGDVTLVGDRGASLSGGQKARINLARAIYQEADIYLLDDPLSAVDTRVSQHLYEECIKSYLANKTIILVTHQVHYLQDADHIIILNNGSVEAEGSFNSLTTENNSYVKQIINEPKENEEVEKVGNESTEKTASIDNNEDDTSSEKSVDSEAEGVTETEKEREHLLKEKHLNEDSSKGIVEGSIFIRYFLSGGSYCYLFLVLISCLLTPFWASGLDYYFSYWLTMEEFRNITNVNETVEVLNVRPMVLSTRIHLWIYAAGLGLFFILVMTKSVLYYRMTMNISKKIHSIIFNSVIGANMNFFETNPGGRILNRFSRDLGFVDEMVPMFLLQAVQMFLNTIGSLILIAIITPPFLVLMIVLWFSFSFIRKVYLKSAQDIKRLEGITKSPVFSHLSATIEGLTTVRAFEAEKILIQEFDKHQDYHTSALYMSSTASSAFGFSLDMCSSAFYALLIFSFLIFQEHFESRGGGVGLAITQATTVSATIQWVMRMYAEVTNLFISVERVLEYEVLPKEIQPAVPKILPKSWPSDGEIRFENIGLRYAVDGPLILKKMNLVIKSKEKIGIVGRTGAGKSSLISALFRLALVEGEIEIDGIHTSDVKLETLRAKLSIIPQDPVLFSGTLRHNLDPFEDYSDDTLYKAIGDVELKDAANVINRLESKVTDKGANYSIGQRQLICLARAILKNNKILILDEATANVDPQTDALIQNTIRKKFVDCTILTIAHRLNTIMDSDKVLVIDAGRIREFDHPHILLQNTKSLFHKMVMKTERNTSEQLRGIAAESFKRITNESQV